MSKDKNYFFLRANQLVRAGEARDFYEACSILSRRAARKRRGKRLTRQAIDPERERLAREATARVCSRYERDPS